MNNDFLAAITGVLPGMTPVQPANRQNGTSSESADFSSLLQNRLSFDLSSSATNAKSSTGFFAGRTGVETLNPLLISGSETRFDTAKKFAAEPKSEIKQENSRPDMLSSRKTTEKKPVNSVGENAKKQNETMRNLSSEAEAKTSDADNTEAEKIAVQTDKPAEVSLEEQLAALQALLENIEPERQSDLMQVIQQLSSEEIQAILENPEEGTTKLLEIVNEMPDSEVKQNLLSLFEKPEITDNSDKQTEIVGAGLVDAMPKIEVTEKASSQQEVMEVADSDASTAWQSTNKNAAENELDQNNTGQVVENDFEAKAVDVEAKPDTEALKKAISEAETKMKSETAVRSDDATEEATYSREEAVPAATEVKADENDQVTVRDKGSKQQTGSGKNDDLEQKLEAVAKQEQTGDHESLRQEFKRLNENLETVENETASAENGISEQGETPQSATNTVPGTTDIKSAAEEFAKRLFTALNEKTSNSPAKTEESSYAAAADGMKKNVQTSGGSTNSGMNNGFSFQSNTSSTSGQVFKQGSTAATPNLAFSEMLEKAEFVKTRDGSKVLNLELDPKDLGKVEMELTSKDGNVTARISAESAMAKAKLDELAPQIKEQLLNQGVNLSEITVDISSRNPDEGNRNQMSGGKNKSGRIGALKNEKDAETIIRKNVLPNLRRAALNIKAVDMTV